MPIWFSRSSATSACLAAALLVAASSGMVGAVDAVAAPQVAASTTLASSCDMATPCEVPEGRYMVKRPAAWDGKSPIAAVVWFHGYQQTATDVMADANLDLQFSRQNILMIVPDGRDRSWSFPNGPLANNPRDEIAFIGNVIADAEKRYPIDLPHLFTAGFSLGATMVWTEACAVPSRFSAYVAFSGDFWNPLPKSCAKGSVRLLQIHGTADQVFPIHGRQIANGRYMQGDALEGLELWREWKSCPAFASTRAPVEDLIASSADTCADGSQFTFWQHTRAHEIDPVWIFAAIDWVKHEWVQPIR